jgi:hypothetical protein
MIAGFADDGRFRHCREFVRRWFPDRQLSDYGPSVIGVPVSFQWESYPVRLSRFVKNVGRVKRSATQYFKAAPACAGLRQTGEQASTCTLPNHPGT